VQLTYRPDSFTQGLVVSGLALVLIVASLGYAVLTRKHELQPWSAAAGALLVVVFLGMTVKAYWG
jgi:multisubunit Na+/H+ antiporter MnhB subunit